MAGRSKTVVFRCIAIVVACLLTASVVETGYRVFMRIDLERTIGTERVDEGEVIGIVSFPHPMVHNTVYGHDFYSGPIVTGAIRGNRFDFCEIREQFDSEGNLKARDQGESLATKTIALFGSSYTLMTDEEGASAADIAARILQDRLGQRVRIINYSRGSFGILQMLDMARARIRGYRPDLVLFVFNTSDLSRPRNWPIFEDIGGGHFRFYMSRSADPRKLGVDTARLNPQVVSSRFTPDWCRAMMAARLANDEARLSGDSLVKEAVEQFRANRFLRKTPEHNVDLLTLTTSYVWLRLRHGNPYHDAEVFAAGENPVAPISMEDFRLDHGFVAGLAFLRESGIPFAFVHLPCYAEMNAGREFKFGIHGVPADREEKLVASLQEATGAPIGSLLTYMHPPVADAAALVKSAFPPHMDWHPNAAGTKRIGSALADFIADWWRGSH